MLTISLVQLRDLEGKQKDCSIDRSKVGKEDRRDHFHSLLVGSASTSHGEQQL